MSGKLLYYLTGEFLCRLLPKRAVYAIGEGYARVYAGASVRDRRIVTENIKAALPGLAPADLKRTVRELFINYSRYLVDLFYSEELTPDFVRVNIAIEGLEHLDRALGLRKGVLLVSAHLGNWELGGMALSRLGYRITGVAAPHQNRNIDGAFLRRRAASGLSVAFLDRSLRPCYEALKNGEIVAMNADRLYAGAGEPVRFMDRDLLFPTGIKKLSRVFGSPALPAFFLMQPKGKYRVQIGPPLDPLEPTRDFAVRAQEMIRKNPSQWFVFQPFWEQPKWPI